MKKIFYISNQCCKVILLLFHIEQFNALHYYSNLLFNFYIIVFFVKLILEEMVQILQH